MDLTFSEDQQALRELADTILGDAYTPEKLRALDTFDASQPSKGADQVNRGAWKALTEAGLVGIAVDEAFGGGGLGLLEVGIVLEAAARHAAPLPLAATMVQGAAPIQAFGSDSQKECWLTAVASGTVLTGCIGGHIDNIMPGHGLATVHGDGADRTLSGRWPFVAFGDVAAAYVVPVAFADGSTALAVVSADRTGIVTEQLAPMSGEASATVTFTNVELKDTDVLVNSVSSDAQPLRWWWERATAATCVAQVGTCEGALRLTATYVSQREQFGSKLATFQAVAHRAADAYTDTELIRLTAWHAWWRLAQGLDAADELAIAKHFAAEAAQRVVFAAQHLHGGIGVDLDYPVHRFFRFAKTQELCFGSGSEHLASLGKALAAPAT